VVRVGVQFAQPARLFVRQRDDVDAGLHAAVQRRRHDRIIGQGVVGLGIRRFRHLRDAQQGTQRITKPLAEILVTEARLGRIGGGEGALERGRLPRLDGHPGARVAHVQRDGAHRRRQLDSSQAAHQCLEFAGVTGREAP